jgi:hypothetical protein
VRPKLVNLAALDQLLHKRFGSKVGRGLALDEFVEDWSLNLEKDVG